MLILTLYRFRCQDLFIREVIDKDSHRNIAMNKALKENVFMMIICIENRIPLFLVGKPGSSKSLSKSMVIDAMKGNSSKKQLFKDMKRVRAMTGITIKIVAYKRIGKNFRNSICESDLTLDTTLVFDAETKGR